LRLFTVCCWLIVGGEILAESPAVAQPATLAATAAATPASISGDEFMARVLSTLRHRPSVAARMRHTARLHEIAQSGSGRYWQRGTLHEQVTRWEMQIQVAGKMASYVQVFDGNYRWTDRTLPSGRRVYRLDTSRLPSHRRSAPLATNAFDAQTDFSIVATEGQGGLAEMLFDTMRRFTFARPRPSQLDGMAVYALVGQWRQTELEKLWPEMAGAKDLPPWPRQLPHHVLLLVGKNNLFPYVVEHRRVEDAHLVASAVGDRPAADPLLRQELYEVLFASAMDDSLFQYKPGDVEWSDETSLVLERSVEVARRSEATGRAGSSPSPVPAVVGDDTAR
jgi:hypothetical protein